MTIAERKKEWRQNNREKCRAYAKKWRDNNPEKHRQSQIRWRSESGRDYYRQHYLPVKGKNTRVNKRPRPNACEVCGVVGRRLGYHHWDDEYPCLGLWLCHNCHRMAERVDRRLHIIYLREKHGMVLVTS